MAAQLCLTLRHLGFSDPVYSHQAPLSMGLS